MSTTQPIPPRPDVGTMYAQWDSMVARVQQAEADRQQSHELNIKLVAENEQNRETMDRLQSQLDYYRNFSIAVAEQISLIGDVSEKVLKTSRDFARNAPHNRVPIIAEADLAEETWDAEGTEVQSILTRVGRNGEDARLPRAGL